MNSPEVDLLNKIKAAAPAQEVEFKDPKNAFMIWADLPTGVQYCGGRETLESANKLADSHLHLEHLYVVSMNPTAAILPFRKGKFGPNTRTA